MGNRRRIGGLPLAVYVLALLLIPLTAVGLLSAREVARNNAEASAADRVAAAASADAVVAAIMVPLEVERSLMTGLATVDDLGLDRGAADASTGLDLIGLLQENGATLDRNWEMLRPYVFGASAFAEFEQLGQLLAENRSQAVNGTIPLEGVEDPYDAADALLADALARSASVVQANSLASTSASQSMRHLDLVLDVLTTGVGQTRASLSVELTNDRLLVREADISRAGHGIALERASAEYPRQIGALTRTYDTVRETLPSREDGRPPIDQTALTGFAHHIEYLSLVSEFSRAAVEEISADIAGYADESARRNTSTLLLLSGVGLFTLFFWIVVTQSFVRPLNRLRNKAEEISGGELNARPVALAGPSDVRKVAGALNEMSGTLSSVSDHMDALASGQRSANADVALPAPSASSAGTQHLAELPGQLGAKMRNSMERVTALTAELQRSQSQLAQEARVDHLTGLPNRFAVLEHLDAVLDDASADGPMQAGVMFLDVDGFKSVNDTHGHAVGDSVLREIARRLQAAIRDIDYVARLGGDEFIVVIAGGHRTELMSTFGHRLIAEIEQPYAIGDQLFVVSASIGLTHLEPGDAALTAIQRADAAVYQAKRRGRRRVEAFDKELQRSIEHQAELELALRQAIRHNELRMHLQPLGDLRTGMPIGAEALIRWERPGHGLVAPADFIPVAERSGLIFELERWVLANACRRIAQWEAMGQGAGMRLAVNMSGRHLIEGNLIADIDHAIEATGANPNLLEIELTESQLLDDVDAARSLLSAIRRRGIKVAIDDFGTGYSSMTYLQKLPVDAVKIDRSFVSSATSNSFDSTIIDTVVTIGNALNLDIVAEGIETVEQLRCVREAGVTHGQGFLLSRPVVAEEAEAVIFNGPLFDPETLEISQRLGVTQSATIN